MGSDNRNTTSEADASLEKLEKEQSQLEDRIWELSVALLRPHYGRRREVTRQLAQFWPTVLDECELLNEYMNFQDVEAIDALRDLWVEWDPYNPKNFCVEFEFAASSYFPPQTVRKALRWDAETEAYASDPAPLNWLPHKSLVAGPRAANGDSSFFVWFTYTDPKDATNSEISRLISDEIFPHALDFWRSANDDNIEEEYDISD